MSFESSQHADYNGTSYSLVRLTAAFNNLKAPRKHLPNWIALSVVGILESLMLMLSLMKRSKYTIACICLIPNHLF